MSEAGSDSSENVQEYILWMDGLGAWLVYLGKELEIGAGERVQVSHNSERPNHSRMNRLSLLANLSSHHATIQRTESGYLLIPIGGCSLNGRKIKEPAILHHGSEIQLGSDVRLKFSQPNPLTLTAIIEFQSAHRPPQHTDGMILMESACLVGFGHQFHIQSSSRDENITFYQNPLLTDVNRSSTAKLRPGLFCQSPSIIQRDCCELGMDVEILPNQTYETEDHRFRFEPFIPAGENLL